MAFAPVKEPLAAANEWDVERELRLRHLNTLDAAVKSSAIRDFAPESLLELGKRDQPNEN